MKKFFILCVSFIFVCFSTFSLTSCSKKEIDKISKNLNTYAISAILDDEKKEIDATEKIIFYNNTEDDVEFVFFHLYPRAFREGATVKPYTGLTEATCFPNGVNFGDLVVIKVLVNGEKKDHELMGEDDDILKVNFGFKLTKKKSVEIVIEFKIIIPNSTHRFGWFDGNINLGNWYPVLAEKDGGEFDLSPYYATGDPFYSAVANYDVEFSFPQTYQLVSTGEAEVSSSGGVTKAKISAKAVRDFAMCLSNKSNLVSTSSSGGVRVNYLADIGDTELNKYLQISKEAVEFFSKTFGEYPYKTISVAKTPFIYGGMEYPNLVFISNSIDDESEYLKVIVHEIAHQWWYGVVGNNEIKEAWLDESLAEYSTMLFFKNHEKYNLVYDDLVSDALSSYVLYVDVIQTLRGDVNTKMNLAVNQYQNDYEYSYMVYVKGVIMFDSLKNMVGERNVVEGLKKYYQDNKFGLATAEDFFVAFEKACHKDLREFFNGFLNGTTIISSIN